MSFYSDIQNDVSDILKEFGLTYTFTHSEQGTYKPGTGQTPKTETTYTAVGIKDTYNLDEMNNSSISQGDVKMYMEDASFNVGDTVTFDGKNWKIMAATPIKPASEAVLYELQVRS